MKTITLMEHKSHKEVAYGFIIKTKPGILL